MLSSRTSHQPPSYLKSAASPAPSVLPLEPLAVNPVEAAWRTRLQQKIAAEEAAHQAAQEAIYENSALYEWYKQQGRAVGWEVVVIELICEDTKQL